MDVDAFHKTVFLRGSKTFYQASRLFPKAIRRDVFTLYAFLRVADNLVDERPVDPEEFHAFRNRWRAAEGGSPAGDWVIDPFIALSRRKGFHPQWTEEFLAAMESDLTARTLNSLDEVLHYTRGSAEVVGLFMLKIFEIPTEAEPAATLLGRSMQLANILRDVAEDHGLGRRYLPLGESGLADLSRESAQAQPEVFARLIRSWTTQYQEWQKGGEAGYQFLPWRLRVAVKTASDLCNWTAGVIRNHPFVVWKRQIKPSRFRILRTGRPPICFLSPPS